MSMSRKKCCVPGCMDSGSSHKTMHLFPNPENDKDRFNQWVLSIGGDILGLENEDIYKRRSVCHAHFEEKYCTRFNRLSAIAVPTLNLPGPLSIPKFTFEERRPLRVIQNSTPSTSSEVVTAGYPKEPFAVDSDTENTEPKSAPKFSYGRKRSLKETQYSAPPTSGCPTQPLAVDIDKAAGEKNIGCSIETLTSGSSMDIGTAVIKSADGQTNKTAAFKTGRAVLKRRSLIKVTLQQQHLYQKLLSTRVKLSKCRNKLQKQSASLKAAKNIVSNPTLLPTMESLSPSAKTLFAMQFREAKKKNKGRRFSQSEKILALAIFKRAPNSYRFLRRLLILPAPQTLAKLISTANIKPGINKNIFAQIKDACKTMKIKEKLCIVMFDEMHLKAGICFNERKDKVVGFATDGEETTQDFADHAQVYMVRGLVKNYKQPLSYSFSAAATSGQQIAKNLKQVITELQQAGLIVVATVCDQGSNNRQAIKLLVSETRGIYLRDLKEPKENIILVNNQEIVPLFDPPHLLKCIRNNLLTKNLEFTIDGEKKVAKWEHLKLLHKENPGYKGVRLIPKLTDYHVSPEKNKMKVKYATQIFSRTVASNMGYLAGKKILPEECTETADALIFFDNLFDSVNGSNGKKEKQFAKPLLGPVTPNSAHHEEWQKAKKILTSMKFLTTSKKKENVPTLKNWAWTLDGVEVLLKNLELKYNVTSVWMRHLNQDPIENFFGAIRSHGCRNTNPTPEKFESSFSTLVINNLSSVHAPTTNCEADFCENLHKLIISDCEAVTPSETDYYLPEIVSDETENNDPRVTGIINYMTGYFIKKLQSKIFKTCQECNKDLIAVDEHEYIKYREFTGRRWLCSPTHVAVSCIAEIHNISNGILKENLHKDNLKEIIKTTIVTFTDFDFLQCQSHKFKNIDFLLKITIRFFVHNYCKEINKILCGRRDCNNENDDKIKLKAKKYFKKCFKRPFVK